MRKPVLTASFLTGLTQQERSGTALEEGQLDKILPKPPLYPSCHQHGLTNTFRWSFSIVCSQIWFSPCAFCPAEQNKPSIYVRIDGSSVLLGVPISPASSKADRTRGGEKRAGWKRVGAGGTSMCWFFKKTHLAEAALLLQPVKLLALSVCAVRHRHQKYVSQQF